MPLVGAGRSANSFFQEVRKFVNEYWRLVLIILALMAGIHVIALVRPSWLNSYKLIRSSHYSKLESCHYVAHLLIMIALFFNFIWTVLPLAKELLQKKSDNNIAGTAKLGSLMLSFVFFLVPFLYPILFVLFALSADSLDVFKQNSLLMIRSINILFIAGGFGVAWIDFEFGRTNAAVVIDLPFFLSISLITVFSAMMLSINPLFSVGLSSGGLAFQLIGANIMYRVLI